MVNDYETILQQLNIEDGELARLFNTLVEDFIHTNPKSFDSEVGNDWSKEGVEDKLTVNSPIPLNSEQIQILAALRKDGCKYLIVEGPPGTGKSHTITAIVFDAILNNKSVLVISDKKEALDVVEDKITETMDKVRFDEENFQNPILRLGKIGNTYGKILAKPTIAKIKTFHQAFKNSNAEIDSEISGLQDSLKEDLEAEILSYGEVEIKDIQEFYALDTYYDNHPFYFEKKELFKDSDSTLYFDKLRSILKELPERFEKNDFARSLAFDLSRFEKKEDISLLIPAYLVSSWVVDARKQCADKIESIARFKSFSDSDLLKLKNFYNDYEKAKLPVFGYLFNSAKLRSLNANFRNAFPFVAIEEPHKSLKEICDSIEAFEYFIAVKEKSENTNISEVDYLELLLKAVASIDSLESFYGAVESLDECIEIVESGFKLYPESFIKLGISVDSLSACFNNPLATIANFDFERAMNYVDLHNSLKQRFGAVPNFNYDVQKKEIEHLMTAKATHLFDTRLIDFYEQNKSDAEIIRNIIKDKKKFPKEQFIKLKEAFPCILAGIRDYAEYIPLEPEIFDLVIIDEASQVSIAQAFPALIRAKKILILGDKKQFSNIKASQARSETNREYLNSLSQVFKENVSNDDSRIVKLEKFDIKTSILDFFEHICNYNTQLLKHFRGYKELISYSNKFFYQNSLQVMKIRGKNIDDVLKFSFIEHDGKEEIMQNTNQLEVGEIVKKLKELKDGGKNLSVGIITPHTNQQKLLMEAINSLPERDYYFETLKLKIMTFDTCQGEERDIIFYSMVASEKSDHLWGVFIKDFNSIDSEDEGMIKTQRLNVGFSRAKECMHFILSKPLDKFSGSIGDALRHYYYTLEEAKKEKSVDDVDKNSKMEPEVLNWFYQTNFWKNNSNRIEFIPQFEIGKYLKQLDLTYSHPNYKVDFLLVYKDDSNKERKIVIEYDGFKEHFNNNEEVNELNYKRYYSEDDVYREKVLEVMVIDFYESTNLT